MRYVISTNDSEGLIGIQLSKWQKDGKLDILEKSETLVVIKAQLAKVSSALEILRKAGYNSEVMKVFLQKKTGLSMQNLDNVLHHQQNFLKQIGALK